MKVLFLMLAFAAVVMARRKLTPEEGELEFNKHVKRYNLRFGRSENIVARKRDFIRRLENVEEHNEKFYAGESTYELDVNEFSHLSDDELKRQKLGDVAWGGENVTESEIRRSRRATAPQNFDWRNLQGGQIIRPVQDQGACGSCWAFGGVAAVEAQMGIKYQLYDKLSEQELIDCVKVNGFLRGCNGGWDYTVYDHAAKNNGITTLARNPYIGKTKACNLANARTAGSKVSTWYILPKNNEVAMRDTLFNIGPMYVSIYIADDFYYYRSGIYQDNGQCPVGRTNHGILLIGYGTENGVDYWLFKNSWGSGWGDRGFFKMRRGVGTCGIGLNASYPKLA